MKITAKNHSLYLRTGTARRSIEKFPADCAKELEAITNGTVANLKTKTNQYRILTESDFQKLYGLVKDVERIRIDLRGIAQIRISDLLVLARAGEADTELGLNLQVPQI